MGHPHGARSRPCVVGCFVQRCHRRIDGFDREDELNGVTAEDVDDADDDDGDGDDDVA